jgi:hypothetical protein
MTSQRTDQDEPPYLNRPAPKRVTPGSGVPDLPEQPPRQPDDPPDKDGVQGDEGGGEYPGKSAGRRGR